MGVSMNVDASPIQVGVTSLESVPRSIQGMLVKARCIPPETKHTPHLISDFQAISGNPTAAKLPDGYKWNPDTQYSICGKTRGGSAMYF